MIFNRRVRKKNIQNALRRMGCLAITSTLALSCQWKKSLVENSESSSLDAIPFSKAGGENATTLASVHASSMQSSPASVRPDPDLYARRLLKQFRTDGNTLARQLGQVEQYRLMLGGASDDFRTVPQETYDATSLLTLQKIAQDICVALLTPDSSKHPGWASVLPETPTNIQANIKYLMRRMLGLSESTLNSTSLTELVEMVNAFPDNGVITAKSYLTACTAIAMDAEALLL